MVDLLIILAFVTYAVWTGFRSRKDAEKGPEEMSEIKRMKLENVKKIGDELRVDYSF